MHTKFSFRLNYNLAFGIWHLAFGIWHLAFGARTQHVSLQYCDTHTTTTFNLMKNDTSNGSHSIHHTCHLFLSIWYWSNSEYWSQKRTQNGNIHSTQLDVYAEKQSALDLSFISFPLKQGRKYYALAYPPPPHNSSELIKSYG